MLKIYLAAMPKVKVIYIVFRECSLHSDIYLTVLIARPYKEIHQYLVSLFSILIRTHSGSFLKIKISLAHELLLLLLYQGSSLRKAELP